MPICEANLDDLADIAVELMNLSAYKAPPDRDWIKWNALCGIRSPKHFGRLAVLRDGTYCGLIVGSVEQMLFSPKLMAYEETIYVREGTPFRASIAGQMMDALEHWAFVTKGADFIRAGETSEICPKAVDAFLRRKRYRRNGTLYVKERS